MKLHGFMENHVGLSHCGCRGFLVRREKFQDMNIFYLLRNLEVIIFRVSIPKNA